MTQNSHIEHIEDLVLIHGVNGARRAINYIRSIKDKINGVDSSLLVSTKWDGSVSVFMGTDPADGRFFVSKKSILNKIPKVYKSHSDIDSDVSGDLSTKLKLLFDEYKNRNIDCILQGDFLYDKTDLFEVVINDIPHIAFHPNTIAYSLPKNSRKAQQIIESELGLAWHTKYTGTSLEKITTDFGIPTVSTKESKVISIDVAVNELTPKPTDKLQKMLSSAGKTFNRITKETLDGVSMSDLTLKKVKTFINYKIKREEPIIATMDFVTELMDHVRNHYEDDMNKKKTETGRNAAKTRLDTAMAYFEKTDKKQLTIMLQLYIMITDLKLELLNIIKSECQFQPLLLRNDGSIENTHHEGFVLTDPMSNLSVKLVDRTNFSYANFSDKYKKGWNKRIGA